VAQIGDGPGLDAGIALLEFATWLPAVVQPQPRFACFSVAAADVARDAAHAIVSPSRVSA
jgi:hypothetical protein